MSQYDQLMAELTSATPPPVRAADIPRTWWDVGKDTFAALDRGVANVAQGIVGLPVDALNFVNQFNPAYLTPASWGGTSGRIVTTAGGARVTNHFPRRQPAQPGPAPV